MSITQHIPLSLTALLAASTPALAGLQWSIYRSESGNIALHLANGESETSEFIIPSGDYVADQPMTVTLSLDAATHRQHLTVDWTAASGQPAHTLAAVPVAEAMPPADHVRMRWSRVGVVAMPTDLSDDQQICRFLINHTAQSGLLLHGVETNAVQPPAWGHVEGDVDADTMVNVHDILQVVSHWTNLCDLDESCQGDADFDGDVDANDLLMILSNYNADDVLGGDDGEQDDEVSTVDLTGKHVAWTWTPTTEDSLDNMVPFIWAPSWRTAEDVAADTIGRPEGHRVVFFFANIVNDLAVHPEDACLDQDGNLTAHRSPWIDHGIDAVRDRVRAWMEAFTASHGTLDAVILDNELTTMASQFMGSDGAKWSAIMDDPRFPQLAEELGFTDLHSVYWGNERYHAWDRLMAPRFDAAINTAVFDVVREYFPDAACANYNSFTHDQSVASLGIAGHALYRDSDGCGTHDSRSFYGRISPALASTAMDGDTPVGNEAWSSLMLCLHRLRGMQQSTSRPMMPWVCNRSWEGSSLGYTPLQDNILWDELILHLGMHGVNRFLYWTNVNPLSEPADSENNPVEDQRRLNELMQELDVHIGQMEAGSPLMQPSFGEDVTASAIADGQHVVWRFSFHPGVAAVAVRFTDGEEFYLQPEPGRRGVWFKHAAHRQLELNTLGSAPSLTAVIPSME